MGCLEEYLRDKALKYIGKNNITKRAFAKQIGVDEGILYGWLSGTYRYSSSHIKNKISDFFAEKSKLEKSKRFKVVESFMYSKALRDRIPEYANVKFKRLVAIKRGKDES